MFHTVKEEIEFSNDPNPVIKVCGTTTTTDPRQRQQHRRHRRIKLKSMEDGASEAPQHQAQQRCNQSADSLLLDSSAASVLGRDSSSALVEAAPQQRNYRERRSEDHSIEDSRFFKRTCREKLTPAVTDNHCPSLYPCATLPPSSSFPPPPFILRGAEGSFHQSVATVPRISKCSAPGPLFRSHTNNIHCSEDPKEFVAAAVDSASVSTVSQSDGSFCGIQEVHALGHAPFKTSNHGLHADNGFHSLPADEPQQQQPEVIMANGSSPFSGGHDEKVSLPAQSEPRQPQRSCLLSGSRSSGSSDPALPRTEDGIHSCTTRTDDARSTGQDELLDGRAASIEGASSPVSLLSSSIEGLASLTIMATPASESDSLQQRSGSSRGSIRRRHPARLRRRSGMDVGSSFRHETDWHGNSHDGSQLNPIVVTTAAHSDIQSDDDRADNEDAPREAYVQPEETRAVFRSIAPSIIDLASEEEGHAQTDYDDLSYIAGLPISSPTTHQDRRRSPMPSSSADSEIQVMEIDDTHNGASDEDTVVDDIELDGNHDLDDDDDDDEPEFVGQSDVIAIEHPFIQAHLPMSFVRRQLYQRIPDISDTLQSYFRHPSHYGHQPSCHSVSFPPHPHSLHTDNKGKDSSVDAANVIDALMAKMSCPICYRSFRRRKKMIRYQRMNIQRMKRMEVKELETEIADLEYQLAQRQLLLETKKNGEKLKTRKDTSLASKLNKLIKPKQKTPYHSAEEVREDERRKHNDGQPGKRPSEALEDAMEGESKQIHSDKSQSSSSSSSSSSSNSNSSSNSTHPLNDEGDGVPDDDLVVSKDEEEDDSIVDDEQQTTELRVAKCGHVYCQACIETHIKQFKRSCPVCNQPIQLKQLYPLFL